MIERVSFSAVISARPKIQCSGLGATGPDLGVAQIIQIENLDTAEISERNLNLEGWNQNLGENSSRCCCSCLSKKCMGS